MARRKRTKTEEPLRPQDVFQNPVFSADAAREGEAVSKAKLKGKALLLIALFITLAMVIIYILSLLVNSDGAFTVRIGDMTNRNFGKTLSLSETEGFANPTVKLSGIPMDAMDNITYEWLDLKQINSKDGSHNGENYLAYTFYIRNSGTEILDYNLQLQILKVTRNVDKAIRVMLIREDTDMEIYAKPSESGGTEPVPDDVINFESSRVVFSKIREKINPGESDKYTIVVWLEGQDPECVDAILKGIVKMQLVFDVKDDDVKSDL